MAPVLTNGSARLGTTFADGNGTAKVTILIPSDTMPGVVAVRVSGTDAAAAVKVTVK